MSKFPAISKNKDIVRISFGNVPVWNGVQKAPGVQKSLPIELSTQQGPIAQCATTQVVNDVIDTYKANDYKFITPPPGSSDWANFLGESKLKAVEKLIGDGVPPRNILEVGAGSTWVASKLQEKYNPDSYVIVDPSIQESSEDIEIIREYFPNKEIEGRRFDLVLGLSVLEHVPNPVLFLSDIKKHLTSDGVVMLVYPDCEAQMLKGDINVIIHEHISYFTKASTRWLASTCGFEIKYLKSENDCFTLVLTPVLGEINPMVKIADTDLLAKGGESFRCLFENLKNKVSSFLESGRTVGFHGATNGLNIFLHLTGLGDSSKIYIYDGDKSKEGLYLPACNSPIMLPTDGTYSTHSLMVISAMSFFDSVSSFAINEAGYDQSKLLPLVGYPS